MPGDLLLAVSRQAEKRLLRLLRLMWRRWVVAILHRVLRLTAVLHWVLLLVAILRLVTILLRVCSILHRVLLLLRLVRAILHGVLRLLLWLLTKVSSAVVGQATARTKPIRRLAERTHRLLLRVAISVLRRVRLTIRVVLRWVVGRLCLRLLVLFVAVPAATLLERQLVLVVQRSVGRVAVVIQEARAVHAALAVEHGLVPEQDLVRLLLTQEAHHGHAAVVWLYGECQGHLALVVMRGGRRVAVEALVRRRQIAECSAASAARAVRSRGKQGRGESSPKQANVGRVAALYPFGVPHTIHHPEHSSFLERTVRLVCARMLHLFRLARLPSHDFSQSDDCVLDVRHEHETKNLDDK